MLFHSWLQNLRSALAPRRSRPHHQRRGSLRAAIYRPKLEVLEDRRVPAFLAPVDSGAASPSDVKAADFNGDGIMDLAMANSSNNGISVLLGNGDGTFHGGEWEFVYNYPTSLAVGDFNADGNLDLATNSHNDHDPFFVGVNDIVVLLGNGDGTLASPVYLGTNLAADSVATGDLNSDGHLDLIATGPNGGLGVLLGYGDGTFAPAMWYDSWGYSLALADFNGDGNTDVALTDFRAVVFLGNGDGTLQEPSVFGADLGSSLAVADFDADGILDLAATSYAYNGADAIYVLRGNGDGTFQPAQSFAAGADPNSVTAGDVNGDGVLDLVVANPGSYESYDGAVSVLLGNGDGGFAGPMTFTTGGSYTSSVAVADFNTDGRPDAVAANTNSNNVSVFINDGIWDGSPPPPALRITDPTVTEGNTGTASATFTVTLSAPSTQPVTVGYSTANGSATAGSDYQAASGTLTFAPGETTKTISVPVIGDRLVEPNETFVVNLSRPTNAILADGQGVGTIIDNEPRVSISDVTKVEGRKNQTTLFTFTVTLSAAYDQPVTVSYQTVNGSAKSGEDYTAKSGTLTFAPGETAKTITIAVKGDTKKEANETFYLDLFGLSSNALFTKSRGIGTILNDD